MISGGRLLALREQEMCKPQPSLMPRGSLQSSSGCIVDGVFTALTLLISIARGLNGGFGEGHKTEIVRVRSPVLGACSWQV